MIIRIAQASGIKSGFIITTKHIDTTRLQGLEDDGRALAGLLYDKLPYNTLKTMRECLNELDQLGVDESQDLLQQYMTIAKEREV